MFYDVIKNIGWDETTEKIMRKTDADVRRALAKRHLSVDDFMALVSPAADKYLEQMARLSRMYTRERFGKTINMFIPIYITNSCANSCVYCGFHVQNKMPRTILTEEEIVREYQAIKKLGPFDNLLVLTGENPAKAGVDYIARALDLAKPYFNNLQIEVMPLATDDYAKLRRHGLNGVICSRKPTTRRATRCTIRAGRSRITSGGSTDTTAWGRPVCTRLAWARSSGWKTGAPR